MIEIVSSGNSSHDYVRKLNLYITVGVREYWIVNSMEQPVYAYHFEQDYFKTKTYNFQDNVNLTII